MLPLYAKLTCFSTFVVRDIAAKHKNLKTMKKLICLLIVLCAFFSCDWLEDATTVDIDTNLKFNIPVSSTAVQTKSASASEAATYTFEGSDIISLSENSDVADYLKHIESMKLNGNTSLVFSGMTNGNTINSISFTWGYSTSEEDSYTTSSKITLGSPTEDKSKNTVSYTLDDDFPTILDFIENHPSYYYQITISGVSSELINTTAKLKAPVLIEASPL